MENKASLEQVKKEVLRLEKLLESSKNELEHFKDDIPNRIYVIKEEAEKKFNDRMDIFRENIRTTVEAKKEKVTEMINKQLLAKGDKVKKSLNELKVLDVILQVITPEQLEVFKTSNLINISSEKELDKMISKLKTYSTKKLPKPMFFYYYFNLLSDLQIDNDSNEIYFMYIVIISLVVLLLILFSPLLICTYCLFGALTFYKMLKFTEFLTLYESILEYLDGKDTKHERDLLLNSVLSDIEEFLDQVEQDYLEIIDSKKFILNEDEITNLRKDAEKVIKHKESLIRTIEKNLATAKNNLEAFLKQVENDKLQRLKFAETAENLYLTFNSLDWKKDLPKDIYLGKTCKNEVILFPVFKDNILIIAEDISYLFQLAQLHIIQLMMHVHPDRVSQNVLDYKYICGDLQPFLNIPSRSLTILSYEEPIKSKVNSIEENILSRSSTILKSMNSLEDFNNLMETYNASGETYVFTYVFGLNSFTKTYENLLRNGKRTGYFFHIYLTIEELLHLNSPLLIELSSNYYLIKENDQNDVFPVKQSKSKVLSFLEKT